MTCARRLAAAVTAPNATSAPALANSMVRNLAVMSCQRPEPLVTVVRRVPQAYSAPMAEAAKTMTSMM